MDYFLLVRLCSRIEDAQRSGKYGFNVADEYELSRKSNGNGLKHMQKGAPTLPSNLRDNVGGRVYLLIFRDFWIAAAERLITCRKSSASDRLLSAAALGLPSLQCT